MSLLWLYLLIGSALALCFFARYGRPSRWWTLVLWVGAWPALLVAATAFWGMSAVTWLRTKWGQR